MSATTEQIVHVDFQKPRSARALGGRFPGIYEINGRYYERPRINGRPTWRRLDATTPSAAKIELGKKRAQQAAAKNGLAKNPYQISTAKNLADLCDLYARAGCPKSKSNTPRAAAGLKEELAIVTRLKKWWGKKTWDQLHLEDTRLYLAHRQREIAHAHADAARFTGHRMVDRELIVLSNILRHAIDNSRTTGVTHNPLAARKKFHASQTVQHCRDFQPANADELHEMARRLFAAQNSEALGWQLLFEAFTGQRTHEILKLRIDAPAEQPGHVDSSTLHLFRSQTSKGTYEYADLHAALRKLIAAHAAWHTARHPGSPWYFPSPIDQTKPISKWALTQALRRVCAAMQIPHRTSHGLRSYYVSVMRSQGMIDAEIALRIGHKTGGKLIVDVYGKIRREKITFLPKNSVPSWETGPTQSEFKF